MNNKLLFILQAAGGDMKQHIGKIFFKSIHFFCIFF